MKGTRKLIALVLTLMMVFGIFPAAAFAGACLAIRRVVC